MEAAELRKITVMFGGGLQDLFDDKTGPNQRNHVQQEHHVEMPEQATVANLIDHLCRHVMKDTRKELFVLDGHLRPGILVIIDDTDWELMGEEAYKLEGGEKITFVTTLHGG